MDSIVLATARKFPALKPLALWIASQSKETKSIIAYISAGAVITFILAILSLAMLDAYDSTFLASESVHALGIAALIYKLTKDTSCSGLSFRSQQLTALYLGARTFCSVYLEWNIHTLLDIATFIPTCFVVYKMSLCNTNNRSYTIEDYKFKNSILILPCAVLAFFVHPTYYGKRSAMNMIIRMLWAFSGYLEAVSVLPQLRLMQKFSKVENVEAATVNLYVFALGVSRILQFIHWIAQFIHDPRMLFIYGIGELWLPMVIISELVQTFILADFCYYYIRSLLEKKPFTYQLPA